MNDALQPHILVPTDFSEHSDHALRYAASLGERFGATIHLLHVSTLHSLEGTLEAADLPDMDPLLKAADDAARKHLDAGVRHGGAAEARIVKSVVKGVNAWEQIVEYADREPISMIIMAMHSGSGLARLLLGSVTERVLRFAPCPVLVVEKGDRDFIDPRTMAVRLRKIVVADDLSDKTPTALGRLVDWLEPYRPEVHLVHAVELEVPAPYVMTGVSSVFTLDPDLETRVSTMLRSRGRGPIPPDWKLEVAVKEGRPHRILPDYAAEVEADLLVVAGESHIDLSERVLGGTVERIARHAPCPMLVI